MWFYHLREFAGEALEVARGGRAVCDLAADVERLAGRVRALESDRARGRVLLDDLYGPRGDLSPSRRRS